MIYLCFLRRRKLHIPRFAASGKAHSFRCSSFPHKIFDFAGSPIRQADFISLKSCICAATYVTKPSCPTAAEKCLPTAICPHSRWRSQPLSRVSRKQRYNTLDFAKQNRVPTGMPAPLLETQRQRDVPFEIPHFPLQCIYKLRKQQLKNRKKKNAAIFAI